MRVVSSNRYVMFLGRACVFKEGGGHNSPKEFVKIAISTTGMDLTPCNQ